MSYDFHLYLSEKPTREDCEKAMEGEGGEFSWFGTGKEDLSAAFSRTGNEENPLFVLEGPLIVEAGDIPEEVDEYVLDPKWEVVASLRFFSGKKDRALVRRWVVRLAQMKGGAVLDPQEGKVLWPRGRIKPPKFPRKMERIPEVSFYWWFFQRKGAMEKAEPFLEAFSRGIGKKIPVLLNMFRKRPNVDIREEPEVFFKEWDRVSKNNGTLYFVSRLPFLYGSLSFGPWREEAIHGFPADEYQVIKFSWCVDGRLFYAEGKDGAWAEPLVSFFLENCVGWECFYGLSYVERNIKLENGVPYDDLETTEEFPAEIRWYWSGIPAAWGWLMWFGRLYKDRVAPSLGELRPWMARQEGGEIREVGNGLYLRFGKEPVVLEKLKEAPWQVPKELLSEEVYKHLR